MRKVSLFCLLIGTLLIITSLLKLSAINQKVSSRYRKCDHEMKNRLINRSEWINMMGDRNCLNRIISIELSNNQSDIKLKAYDYD